jgi:hypothetical protein
VTTSPFSPELKKLAARSSVTRGIQLNSIAFMTLAKRQRQTTRQPQRGRPVPTGNALSAGELPTAATGDAQAPRRLECPCDENHYLEDEPCP